MKEEQTFFEPTDAQESTSFESTILAEVVENATFTSNKEYRDENLRDTNEIEKKKTLFGKVRSVFSSTYNKRHPIVNALLSIYLFVTLIIAFVFIVDGFLAPFSLFNKGEGTVAVFLVPIFMWFFSLYYAYYMCLFIIGNRKDAFVFAHMGGFIVWGVICWQTYILMTPIYTYDDEGNRVEDSLIFTVVIAFVYSLILNFILISFVYLVMRIKKYGATAWTLLDVSYKRFRSKFDKICFYLFISLSISIIVLALALEYWEYHPSDKYPSHETAKIGDFYYQDGTISSENLSGKKAVGIVFSLESSKEDNSGGRHGQIVALTDVSTRKMQWETVELKDYDNYPNYTWDNRLAALDDIDGHGYVDSEGDKCLSINFECLKYMEYDVDGISSWYVPTAGQWKKIIENLGNTKVDNMLRFNAETASNNLKKINIDPRRWYWTITEFDTENAWSIRIASGEFGSRTSKMNEAYVRPVANF